jgi:LysM repeat protein
MSAKRLIQLSLIIVLVLVSLASTGSASAQSWCGESYVVQRGDWLARIARNCGVSLAELRAANPWTYYDRYIYPGQVLAIPGNWGGPDPDPGPIGYCGPSWDAWGSYWLVCRGDTLGAIARYYGVSWRYLQYNNGIANANRIYPGQVIRP